MSFLSPLFLFAMAAVGLPLIIHLLNLKRPRKLQFSTLAFFKELQKTTIRKIRIKRYLLLLLRLLAIACLAIVLSRPFLPPGFGSSGNSQAPALNAILIDNSISMNRIGQKGPLFEQAKEIIRSIEASSKDSDRFILQVTNGVAGYSTIVGHNQLLRRTDEAAILSSGNYSIERISGLLQVLEEAPYENKRLFIISDGQLSQFNGESPIEKESRSITTTFINLGDVSVQNSVIAGIESSTNMIGIGLPVNLSVQIQNKGEVPIANQFVSLEFEGELVGQYSVSLDAGASQTFAFEIVPSAVGSSNGKVIVEGDEFPADNEYYFSIEIPETRNVLWVKEESLQTDFISYTGAVLEASGENDSQLSYEESTPDELGSINLSEFDAIILDGINEVPEYAFGQLLEFVQNGRGITFFPSETGKIRNYNTFFSQFNVGSFEGIQGEYASFRSIATGSELQEDHPIFAGLFDRVENEELRVSDPDIYYYLKLRPSSSPGGFNIITLNNGDPLVREKRFGEGRLIISAIGNDPGWSNFAIKPLYAPFYYRVLLYAASSDEGGFVNHILGEPFEWIGDIALEQSSIEVEGESVIPEANVTANGTKITYPAQDWLPGWITVRDEQSAYTISVNQERSESEFVEIDTGNRDQILEGLAFVDASDLEGESLQNEIRASGFGREIWSWFMLAGLLFLITESLVSVFYKAETVS